MTFLQRHCIGERLVRIVFIGLSICTFNGCATLIFDRYDKVDMVTEPAGVEIYNKEGFNIGITPVQIPFKRLPRQHLTLRKDGYVDITIVMSTSINPWSAVPYFAYYQEFGNISPGPGIYGKSVIAGVLLTPVVDVLLGGIFKKKVKPRVVRMKKRSTNSALTRVETSDSYH